MYSSVGAERRITNFENGSGHSCLETDRLDVAHNGPAQAEGNRTSIAKHPRSRLRPRERWLTFRGLPVGEAGKRVPIVRGSTAQVLHPVQPEEFARLWLGSLRVTVLFQLG